MIQAELKVLSGKHQGKSIPLTTKKFLVGREQDCQLRPTSDLVSRHHCVFTADDYTVRLRDLGSTNGTLLNGERLEGTAVLKPGDHIIIGKLELEIQIRELSTAEAAAAKAAQNEATASEQHVVVSSGDSATIPVAPEVSQAAQETAVDLPLYQAAMGQAGVYSGDTAIFGQNPYPMQPPAGYPQGMYPGMPAAPYMPMMYPPQVPYPPQYGYPAMPYAPYPQQAMPAAQPGSPAPVEEDPIGVRLPAPEETGVKAAATAPPVGSDGGAAKGGGQDKPSQKAADIIKQYMQRRP